SPGNISEEKESELEEFIDYAKIVMGALGHNIFEPLTGMLKPGASIEPSESEELLLTMKRKSRKSGRIIEASCRQTNEGFVVLKNSLIEEIDSDSTPPTIKEIRGRAKIENGILQE